MSWVLQSRRLLTSAWEDVLEITAVAPNGDRHTRRLNRRDPEDVAVLREAGAAWNRGTHAAQLQFEDVARAARGAYGTRWREARP